MVRNRKLKMLLILLAAMAISPPHLKLFDNHLQAQSDAYFQNMSPESRQGSAGYHFDDFSAPQGMGYNVDGVEYEVWYFGNSHNLSDPYININRSNDVISNITGNLATQTGNLEDLGYHHIAKASVLATQETDGSFSLPLNGTLENQIAIAYVNLERDNSDVVNNLKGSAIVGTTFNFGYDGQKYTLNVSGSNQIAIRGTTTNPSESFVVLFPNNKKDVDLIADGRYLYNFNNPIEAIPSVL